MKAPKAKQILQRATHWLLHSKSLTTSKKILPNFLMPENRTFFLVAGEPSGDTRGAELVRALKKANPILQFEGLGGPKMQAEGVKLRFDLTSISALGFGDVLRQYFKIRAIFY